MFGSDRIIAIDVGASKVVVAEYAAKRHAVPTLMNSGIGHLGVDPDTDLHASALVVSTLRELMREYNIKPGPLYMTVSGQIVFPRYVKLPPVGREKISQIVRYEAQQNVPFPIDEVVWDYQLIGGAAADEVHAMLVAVKVENVTRLTNCVEAAKMEPEIVDAAPMALYNTVRFNYPDLDGCTLVLDIGARSTNLIFVEGDRIFSRSVPVAGNAITQEIAGQFDVPFAEAEQLKLKHAVVGLGGVTAVTEDETAERVSKIVRNVVTRLHAEVNRSINFYRSQQNGSPPVQVLLAGGSSIIPYIDTFFRDKLGVPVDYLNPFVNLPVADNIDQDRISKDVHLLGEVVGLSLRRTPSCPVRINLMPPDILARKAFRRRLPFFGAAALGVVLTLLVFWLYSVRLRALHTGQLQQVVASIGSLHGVQGRLSDVLEAKNDVAAKADSVASLVVKRTRWLQILEAMHACMLDGMWLTAVEPEISREGIVTVVKIRGMGFDDKLRPVDQPQATAIEVFRDRLRESPAFTENTDIEQQPPGANFAREFTLAVELVKPINVTGD